KDAEQRDQSALDVKLDLKWAGVAAETGGPLTTSRKARWWIAASFGAIVLSGVGWWLGTQRATPDLSPMHLAIPLAPETTHAPFDFPFNISPDGRWLVYTVEHEGTRQLYLR